MSQALITTIPPTWTTRVEHHESELHWRAARKTGIGASEVASIFGCGYVSASPVTVWASKTGIAEVEITPTLQRSFDRGHKLEPVIASEFEVETGLTAIDTGDYTIFRHAEIDWLFSTLDRWTVHPEHGPIPVELKSVNGRLCRDWDTEVEPPLKFQVQVQSQMACTGATACYLVGLIGGDEVVVRLVLRNQRFIDAMILRLAEFWGYVTRREMPPIDESEATKSMLGLIYPRDSGSEIMLPDEMIDLDRELLELKEQIKKLDIRKDGIENRIKAAIGESTRGILPSGSYTWKLQHRESYTVEASSFRVLRRSNK